MWSIRPFFNRCSLRSPGRWVLHLCLFASLWRAPVPWLHSHDEMNAASVDVAFWAEHLDHFHAHAARYRTHQDETGTAQNGGVPSGREPSGWHLHFVLPWQLAEHPEGEWNAAKIPESLRLETFRWDADPTDEATWRPAGTSICEVDRLVQLVAAVKTADSPAVPIGMQVLLTYSDRLSWRALAGVARC